jgi:hydroxymethylpyrimidine/phosphomethylpyrimidine kinase
MTDAPPPRILSIAGSDSSGGAGIQADIKTIAMLGGYAMTAITAITAQNTVGVQGIAALEPAMVAQQIASCIEDIGVDAIKIGMLHDAAVIAAVEKIYNTLYATSTFIGIVVRLHFAVVVVVIGGITKDQFSFKTGTYAFGGITVGPLLKC